MSLTPFIHNFLETLGKLGYARTTLSGYAQDLQAFERHVVRCGDLRITDLTLRIVEDYLDGSTLGDVSPSPATRNRRLSCLRSFFRYLIEREELPQDQDPTRRVRFARLAQREPSFLSYNEYARMIQAVRQTTQGWMQARDAAILATFYNTGIRLSELTSLNVEQVDTVGARFLRLSRKGGLIKDIPINQTTLRALAAWMNVHPQRPIPTSCPLFISRLQQRLSRRTVELIVGKYARLAGIQRRVSPHTFRHSVCSELQRRGASLKTTQTLLDHASVQTTMRYSHSAEADLRTALASLDDPDLWQNAPFHPTKNR